MNHRSLSVETRQTLTQTLTPRLQYAVRLLQLSSLDYEQELQEVSGRNPFLDVEDMDDRLVQRGALAAAEAASPAAGTSDANLHEGPAPDGGEDHSDAGGAAASVEAAESWGQDAWPQAPGAARDGTQEAQPSALEWVAAATDLRQHLRSQANLLPLSPRDHALLCAVIESLDDDGYLRLGSEEIESLSGLVPEADACEIGTAVKLVQSFDPAGVGARSVAECLMLQLENLDLPMRPLGHAILSEHLDRLAQRDVAAMARLLGRPAAEIEAVCAALRRLDPRPGWRFARPEVHFVTPDVFARKLRGKWVAQLNPAVVPRLRLNRHYAELFQRHRESCHSELNTHLQEARWTLRNVEQRCATILSVAQAIMRRQYGFFEHGPLAMKPLALRDIATEVGVHESTVCRVTNNKYMATPAGLFELKQFFSRPMAMAGGGTCSPTAIRGVMQELVAAEDVSQPLSDVDIAQRLERQGLKVARRTVTKYRQMLRIPPAERRRAPTAGAPGGA